MNLDSITGILIYVNYYQKISFKNPGSQPFGNHTLGHIKEKLHSIYMEKCMEEIQNSDILPKSITYKTYKKLFQTKKLFIIHKIL